MEKKYLQLPRFQTHQIKSKAISLVEKHVNENLGDFKDGEEIVIEFLDENDTPSYSVAVIKITDGEAKVFAGINENETVKIVETENAPKDTSSLWLAEFDDTDIDSGETSNLRQEIRELKQTVKALQDLVNQHEYALAGTLAGGDILLNAQKYDMENEYEQEKPEDAEYDEDYDDDDTVVTSYDIFVGGSSLREFSKDDTKLYAKQRYKLLLKLYNKSGKLVRETDHMVLTFRHAAEVDINERRFLISTLTGYTTIVSELRIDGVLIYNEPYYVNFGGDQEPDYKPYTEPNVHHQLIKQADTYQILMDNINYLLVNEFCWCPDENKLYLKAKAKNGTIRLFTINGGGSSDIDSGDTPVVVEETRFEVIDNQLYILSSNSAVTVDSDGILNIGTGGTVNEIGTLILTNTTTSGVTPTPPEPDVSTATVDENGNLSIGGNTSTTDTGGVMLNATVTPEGILEITT